MKAKVTKRIYIVRHGESEDNVLPIYQHAESNLTQKGIQQAQAVAKRFAALPIQSLISSPYKRAKHTAEHISEVVRLPIELSDYFSEVRKPSSIEGREHSDPSTHMLAHAWQDSLFKQMPQVEDAENFDLVMERVKNALEYLQSKKESTIAVVSHGFFLRSMLAYIMFGDALNGTLLKSFSEHIKTFNTGITYIEEREVGGKNKFIILGYNDHAHFDAL